MGAAASSGNTIPRVESAPSRGRSQAMLLVNGSVKRGNKEDLQRHASDGKINADDLRKIKQRQKNVGTAAEEDMRVMMREADPATLYILDAVKEADGLPDDKATLKLQLLRGCYPYLEQVPPHRLDHLAVLVYQKEGDVYFAQGDAESAKTTYSRAIQIAETRVARGEKEIYMVLKRYVLSMVGMARLWYQQERDTTGFTFAGKVSPLIASLDESVQSLSSRESSVLSDASVFSLNQEILKSMAPKAPRRRVGPAVNVVKLLRPVTLKVNYSPEDDFVLRSQMTRELKASPCELLLLRCIEVVEIGHRRQSELLIPALIELAQIYEDLKLYNRSLLLVRRCLGILCVVYDYDHPWIIQLRRRADHLMDHMEIQTREDMASKIQATWKMYRAMCQLEEILGRPVTRHVWISKPSQERTPDTDFLKDFVNDLPIGTVLHGAGSAEGPLGGVEDIPNGAPYRMSNVNDSIPSPAATLSEGSRDPSPDVKLERPPSSKRRKTKAMSDQVQPSTETETEDPYGDSKVRATYPQLQHDDEGVVNTQFIPNSRIVDTAQDTQTDTHVQDTAYGGVLTVRTTTVTRTITERIVGSDEDDSVVEEYEDYEEQEEGSGPRVEMVEEKKPEATLKLQTEPEFNEAPFSSPEKDENNEPRSDDTSQEGVPRGMRGEVTTATTLSTRYGNRANDDSSSASKEDAVLHAESVAPSESQMSYSSSVDGRRRMRVWRANLGE
ncbi:hypothetical protein DQ04_03231050 [Trypanosoma grayi]|uniref:hypothetical protein n=1 Tax=Trypanosoma grayi TaxID=71804 RepID=UPI0004F44B6F|nr:hypothetical protein DQ04_03231050 [Trypanosoma grayi]KEG10845.1 hypothetical protein DQ04_03231050 [Trypanosoma grayi]